MLKLVELGVKLKDDGTIEIPIEAMVQMDIHTGDTIQLIYLADSEESMVNTSKEFILARERNNVQEQPVSNENIDIKIPQVLLEDAQIPMNADLEVICSNGKIVIVPSGEYVAEQLVPPELMEIFEEFGISKDKVHVILKAEGDVENGEDNL